MSWQNRTFKHTDEASYPFVQWVNNPADLEPRPPAGGFAVPTSQYIPIEGTLHSLHHRGGGATEVIYTPRLRVAVIATRFAWVKDGFRLSTYENGARGKLQALCYVETVKDEPPVLAMLTFTGITSKRFGAARKAFADSVRKAAAGAPSWAFWMSLKAGEAEMVGKKEKSPITPVELAGETNPDVDYVGDELVDQIEALLDREAREWKAAWASNGTNGEGEIADNGNTDAAVYSTPMPKNSKGYATIGDAIAANDRDTLTAMYNWALQNKDLPLAGLCNTALNLLAGEEEEEIPF